MIKTVHITIFMNGQEVMREYALSDEGVLPVTIGESLQDAIDTLLTIEE